MVDDQVEPGLGDQVGQLRQDLQRALAIPEHDQVVPDEGVVLPAAGDVLQRLEVRLGLLPDLVQAVGVAGLEVGGQGAVRVGLHVRVQDLLRQGGSGRASRREARLQGPVLDEGDAHLGHVIVVELGVAQRHVDIEGEELAVLEEEPLVYVRGLLVVPPQKVDRGKGQLVLHAVRQLRMELHQPGVVALPVGAVEQQPGLKRDPAVFWEGGHLAAVAGAGALSPRLTWAP